MRSSFRDPSGFVFKKDGIVFRHINKEYAKDYDLLLSSGLYNTLTSKGFLVEHAEVTPNVVPTAYKTIQPALIPFISYPYEWSFSMLKDAALLTLEIQKEAINHGMSLKDASAYNIQFHKGNPILIDTLSFERYEEGKPWVAYKQFVEHFLSPLVIMMYVDVRLGRLSSLFLDGIPVDIAAAMLPFRTRLKPSLLFHIFAHASSQKKYSDKKLGKEQSSKKFSKRALFGLIDNLEGTIKSMKWSPRGTQWEDYYEEDKNNYKSDSMKHKAELIRKFVKESNPSVVWDMGANTAHFSRIAGELGAEVIAFDIDLGAVEKGYRLVKQNKEEKLLTLFADLTNPTPAIGWMNEERDSLFNRANADIVLALALIHHLAISNNLPLDYIAESFAKLGKRLIIEFVDKTDSQVQILLSTRKDIFPNYTRDGFEAAFKEYFTIIHKVEIKGSKRTLYLMERID